MSEAAAVSCRDVHYAYPDGTRALEGVSFDLPVGATVALVGANGAGKSTLAQLIVGLLLPAAGSVSIFGTEVSRHTARAVRRRVGLLFQRPDDQLFMPTLIEDVAFGPLNSGVSAEAARAVAEETLATVGLAGLEGRFPGHLSEGQKRIAALATILSMHPELLVLDEPTGGLDPRARRWVIGELARLPQTKLVISHDLEMVLELCPRTVLLDGGQVFADGPTAELLADGQLMEEHGLEVPWPLRFAPSPGRSGSFPPGARRQRS